MGTDNPKVSAYVPQVLKDRLKQFKEDRGISAESQAVTIILAEYFGMPEALGRSPESGIAGGVTLARMEALEERLVDFTVSVESRLQTLAEDIRKITGILVVHEEILDVATEQVDEVLTVDRRLELEPTAEGGDKQKAFSLVEHQDSSLPKNLLGEPLTNSESIQLEFPQVKEANDGSLLNEPPISLQSEPASELQEEIKPIPGTKLSELRFERGKDTIAGVKRKLSLEKFTEWTIDQDPDDIAWKYVESPTKGYVPADELPGELKRKLLIWIEKNIN